MHALSDPVRPAKAKAECTHAVPRTVLAGTRASEVRSLHETGLVHTCAELCIKRMENGRLDTAGPRLFAIL